ncbi:MAG: ABC transporter ATP-binding protein [Deltaproteobacteria bacterium]
MAQILKVDRLAGGYGEQIVVNDVSFGIKAGEFVGVIGPNGSGKSTLLRLMSRALPVRTGTVSFDGRDIASLTLKEYCARVAFVSAASSFEGFSFSVQDIVLMGRMPHLGRFEKEKKRDLDAAEESMRLTDTLSLKDKGIDELSAGERQRVLIARALCQQPRLLFLDEPTSHLDIGHQIQILDLMRRLNREKKITIVMVIHDLNLAGEYCGRLMLLNEGRVFKDGTPEEVLTYQNVESVYKTVVVVKTNPISSKPFIILVSGGSKK